MSTIFIDESGDLSFNFDVPRTPRFFVISALICDDPKVTNKIIKKTLQSLSPKTRKNRQGKALHANKELDRIKNKLLSLVAQNNLLSKTVVLDKWEHAELFGQNKHKIYTHLIYEALRAFRIKKDDEVIISRREIKKSLNTQMIMDLRKLLKHPEQNIEVKIHHTVSGLQIVDFIANAVFCKIEKKDASFFEYIARQDKTLAAFAESNPALLQQGNYLSYPHYTKPKNESQAK